MHNKTFCFISFLCPTHPNSGSPDGLHGQSDEGGDGVGHSKVEHKIMDVGAAPG